MKHSFDTWGWFWWLWTTFSTHSRNEHTHIQIARFFTIHCHRVPKLGSRKPTSLRIIITSELSSDSGPKKRKAFQSQKLGGGGGTWSQNVLQSLENVLEISGVLGPPLQLILIFLSTCGMMCFTSSQCHFCTFPPFPHLHAQMNRLVVLAKDKFNWHSRSP